MICQVPVRLFIIRIDLQIRNYRYTIRQGHQMLDGEIQHQYFRRWFPINWKGVDCVGKDGLIIRLMSLKDRKASLIVLVSGLIGQTLEGFLHFICRLFTHLKRDNGGNSIRQQMKNSITLILVQYMEKVQTVDFILRYDELLAQLHFWSIQKIVEALARKHLLKTEKIKLQDDKFFHWVGLRKLRTNGWENIW